MGFRHLIIHVRTCQGAKFILGIFSLWLWYRDWISKSMEVVEQWEGKHRYINRLYAFVFLPNLHNKETCVMTELPSFNFPLFTTSSSV